MSVSALSWAFSRPMGDPTAKAVLVALADHADENGRCWPSVNRLCLWTALGERAIRYALQRLEGMAAIRREDRAGQTPLYFLDATWQGQEPRQHVHPGMTCSPASGAGPPRHVVHLPRHVVQGTPARGAPEPSRNHHEPPVEPPVRRAAPRTDRGRGERLPADWQPDATLRRYATDCGLDPDATAEAFRDHWHASNLPSAWKRDWNAAFRTWCRIERSRRAAPNGGGNRGGGKGIIAALGKLHAAAGN